MCQRRCTIYVDNQALPRMLQLAEQAALGLEVGIYASKLIHLVLQDVGEDGHINIHFIAPAS